MSPELPRGSSLLNVFTFRIVETFERIGRPINLDHAEELSCFLLHAMGAESRDYHRPEHALEVAKNLSPIGTLAAYFHDLIYVQVDSSWERSMADLLKPFIPDSRFSVNVLSALETSQDPWETFIAELFNASHRTTLTPQTGLNEFLSALVFYRKMKAYLQPEELLRGLSCIESTIPFRNADAEGFSPAERLRQRISGVLESKDGKEIFTAPVDIDSILGDCRQIVLQDLASFDSETLGQFVSNTWSVMYENQPLLRNTYFMLSDYRKAVFGNINFLSSLTAKSMYWFDEAQQESTRNRFIHQAEKNLRLGREYLKAIVISVGIVEAIALETGGNAPFELFFGTKKKSREHQPLNMEILIPMEPAPHLEGERQEIYTVLSEGRQFRSRFDTKTSRLGALLFSRLSEKQFNEAFQEIHLFHQGKIESKAFLQKIDKSLLTDIFRLLEQTALSRTVRLRELATELTN